MGRYIVKVRYSMEKEIRVTHAEDEAEANEKACDIVNKWKDVIDTEAVETTEE